MVVGDLGDRRSRGTVCGPDRPRISLRRRLRAAWRALRGAPVPDAVEVTRAELVEVMHKAFLAAGLPSTWFVTATTDEIGLVADAIRFVAEARDADWGLIEAGGWPR